MPINFPTPTSTFDIVRAGPTFFKWSGTAWVQQTNTRKQNVVEYTSLATPTANTVVVDGNQYNFYKMLVDEDLAITLPINSSPYSSVMIELEYNFNTYGARTTTLSGTIRWAGGVQPNLGPISDNRKILLQFTTYDGGQWIGSLVSENLIEPTILNYNVHERNTAGTSLVGYRPVDYLPDDLFIFTATSAAATTWTMAFNWTQIYQSSNSFLATVNGNSAAAVFAFGSSASTTLSGCLIHVRNGKIGEYSVMSTAGTSTTISSINVSKDKSIVLAPVYSAAVSITPTYPAGWTINASDSSASVAPSFDVASKSFNAGATGNVVVTAASSIFGTLVSIIPK